MIKDDKLNLNFSFFPQIFTAKFEPTFLQFGPTLSRVNPLSKDLADDLKMQNLAVRLVCTSPVLIITDKKSFRGEGGSIF